MAERDKNLQKELFLMSNLILEIKGLEFFLLDKLMQLCYRFNYINLSMTLFTYYRFSVRKFLN